LRRKVETVSATFDTRAEAEAWIRIISQATPGGIFLSGGLGARTSSPMVQPGQFNFGSIVSDTRFV